MALPATETFSGITTDALLEVYSSNWTRHSNVMLGWANPAGVYSGDNNDWSIHSWNADTFDDDQYAEGTYVFYGTHTANEPIGPAVRIDPNGTSEDNAKCYGFFSRQQTGDSALFKIIDNTATYLATGGTVATQGDVFRIEAEGTTITALINDSQEHQVTDSSLSSGRAGLCSFGKDDSEVVSPWEGGNLGAGGPTQEEGAITGSASGSDPLVGQALSSAEILRSASGAYDAALQQISVGLISRQAMGTHELLLRSDAFAALLSQALLAHDVIAQAAASGEGSHPVASSIDLQSSAAAVSQAMADVLGIADMGSGLSTSTVLTDSALGQDIYALSAQVEVAFAEAVEAVGSEPTSAQAIATVIEHVLAQIGVSTSIDEILGTLDEGTSATDGPQCLASALSALAIAAYSDEQWIHTLIAGGSLDEAIVASHALSSETTGAIEGQVINGVSTFDAYQSAVITVAALIDGVIPDDVSQTLVAALSAVADASTAAAIITAISGDVDRNVQENATARDSMTGQAMTLCDVLAALLAVDMTRGEGQVQGQVTDEVSSTDTYEPTVGDLRRSLDEAADAGLAVDGVSLGYGSLVDSISADIALNATIASMAGFYAHAIAFSIFQTSDVADAELERLSIAALSIARAVGGSITAARTLRGSTMTTRALRGYLH